MGQDTIEQIDDTQIRGLSNLYCPQEDIESSVAEEADLQYGIADVLLEMGKLTFEQYTKLQQELCDVNGDPQKTIDEQLLQTAIVDTDDLLEAQAKLNGLEFKRISAEQVDTDILNKIGLDIDYIQNSSACPIALEKDTLIVATSDPSNVFNVEELGQQAGLDVWIVISPQKDIDNVYRLFEGEDNDYKLDDLISDMTEVEVVQDQERDFDDLEKMAGQSPVIKFVNYLITNSIKEGASDIHIEPKGEFSKIRYRIDGILFKMMESPLNMHPAVVSRIKIMAKLDISERRLPQDGKVSVIAGGRAIDLRVSTLPTSHGEKVVIRVLDSKSIMRGLEQSGMEPDVMEAFQRQIVQPHGILLVTGPTGSGKSTTLYSALCEMDGEKLNISTVEDPVEYQLDFCNQVQANETIGLDFACSLRSLLRQDPDIIMIGEIRDNETARIAVQAALTGHLVLSTLHTNDAASSITRLVNIGIDAYLIAASLNAVLAQRLVRRICTKCKQPYQVPENIQKYVERAGVEAKSLFHGSGCDYCRGSGYVGRMGIYELLVIDEAFRDMINKDSSVINMRQAFHSSNAASMFEDGMEKVKQGLTTIEEVLRVTEVYGKNEKEVFVENIE